MPAPGEANRPDQVPALLRNLPEQAALPQYIAGVRAAYGKALTGLLELTVADTGPGIVHSLSEELVGTGEPQEELALLMSASQRNVSRKDKPGAGQGLANMLEDIDKEAAAVQIRSGRFSLFHASLTPDGLHLPSHVEALPSYFGGPETRTRCSLIGDATDRMVQIVGDRVARRRAGREAPDFVTVRSA